MANHHKIIVATCSEQAIEQTIDVTYIFCPANKTTATFFNEILDSYKDSIILFMGPGASYNYDSSIESIMDIVDTYPTINGVYSDVILSGHYYPSKPYDAKQISVINSPIMIKNTENLTARFDEKVQVLRNYDFCLSAASRNFFYHIASPLFKIDDNIADITSDLKLINEKHFSNTQAQPQN